MSALPNYTGQTVVIIGDGPSLTDELLASVSALPRIVANRAVARVPDADILVSIDGNWPAEAENFTGLRIVGVPTEKEALYLAFPHEIVTLAPGHVVHIRNNILAAMRIAVQAGAKKLILLGIDPAEYEALHNFRGFSEGLAALTAELAGQGIEVEDRKAVPKSIRKPGK